MKNFSCWKKIKDYDIGRISKEKILCYFLIKNLMLISVAGLLFGYLFLFKGTVVGSGKPIHFFEVSILSPIVEEIIFRKLLLQNLVKKFSCFWFWNISISALFTSVHLFYSNDSFYLTLIITCSIFSSSVLYGYVAVKENNIILPICLHSYGNTIIYIISHLSQ